MTFLKHLLIILAVIWTMISFGAGRKIDQACVEGRLSAAQAKTINSLEWGKCPRYKKGNCRVEEGDRVVRKECSEFLRILFLR